ncbi:MAG: pyridoxal-phosphate dependent enzyme [Myxococcales bacterium]|nr:pyridoxal-phosphate dependent enzyme [Myxococcales bacterium]
MDDVRAAAARIAGQVRRTPALRVPALDELADAELFLKAENLQHVGAFKARGALHALSRVEPELRARGVITYSSGNHAQAVAYAARAYGVPARIAMPIDAPAVKVAGVRALGGEIIFAGTTSDDRRRAAIDDDAGDLVAEDPPGHPAAEAPLRDLAVGAAEPRELDPQEDLVVGERPRGLDLDQAEDAGLADQRPHRRRDRRRRVDTRRAASGCVHRQGATILAEAARPVRGPRPRARVRARCPARACPRRGDTLQDHAPAAHEPRRPRRPLGIPQARPGVADARGPRAGGRDRPPLPRDLGARPPPAAGRGGEAGAADPRPRQRLRAGAPHPRRRRGALHPRPPAAHDQVLRARGGPGGGELVHRGGGDPQRRLGPRPRPRPPGAPPRRHPVVLPDRLPDDPSLAL